MHLLPIALTTLGVLAQPPVETASEQRLRADVAYLASPDLKGRGQGTPGLESAKNYLLDAYRKMGLDPKIQHFRAKTKALRALAGASPELAPDQPESDSPNIVVVIPGTDPELGKEYIALGAHFDHLGENPGALSLAKEEDRQLVHAGADDNASGTALVLELARRLRERPPRRSILLLHFSGEELGLQGSGHWVKHPTVPLASVKFYFNFDMVGRLDPAAPKLSIGCLGVFKSETELLDRHVPRNITVDHDLGVYLGASDHMSLATQKIPSAFYFTGIHADYHRPTDTPDKINYAGQAQIGEAALGAIRELADATTAPAFDAESAKVLFPTLGRLSRAIFGAQPGAGSSPQGLLMGEPRQGTPAAGLGLRAGDILVRFKGQPVKTLFDLNALIGSCAPGDRVKIAWIRRGKTQEAAVVLAGP